MQVFPEPEKALSDLVAILPLVYGAFEQGTTQARAFYEGRSDSPDPHLFAAITRDGAIRAIDAEAGQLPGLTRVPQANCGIELLFGGYDIRFQKASDGESPYGSSPTRLRFLHQLSFGGAFVDGAAGRGNLIVEWDHAEATGRVDLTLVCTKAGRGGSVDIHWAVPLPHPAEGVVNGAGRAEPPAPVDDLDIIRPLSDARKGADARTS